MSLGLIKLSPTPPQLSLGASHRPPRGEAPIPITRTTMTVRIQLSLFKTPESLNIETQGFSVPDVEIVDKPPTKESNATKKRDKRRAWHIQTNFRKPTSDG